MCLQYVKVTNRTSPNVVNAAFFPCGKCADCRKRERQAWTSRMRTQFLDLKSKGWNLGFITLTYAPENLPYIPDECFTNPLEIRSVPCFNRQHIRQWIKDVRQYCKYHYGFKDEKRIRYFVCSEFGSVTHRPHYHGILCWPPDIGYEKMHAICRDCWKYGFIGPRYYQGDSHCGPFEIIGDSTKTLSYVSKYVSKDVDFVNEIDGLDFYYPPTAYEEESNERQKAKIFVNCLPCHIQSVSLGYEPIKSLTDEAKYKLLIDGLDFVGDDKSSPISLYLKRKLLFDNYYVFENGKRFVRRCASSLFCQYYKDIFDAKSVYYDTRILQMKRYFLEQSGVPSEDSKVLSDAVDYYWSVVDEKCVYNCRAGNIGKLYLAYDHIDLDRCYDIPLHEQWFLRYRKPEEVENLCKDWNLADDSLVFLQNLFDAVDSCYKYVNCVKLQDREQQEKIIKSVINFWKEAI